MGTERESEITSSSVEMLMEQRNKEREIRVQTLVIQRLCLNTDNNKAVDLYISEGYAKKCRELLESDSEILHSLITDNETLQATARLIVNKLKEWDNGRIESIAA